MSAAQKWTSLSMTRCWKPRIAGLTRESPSVSSSPLRSAANIAMRPSSAYPDEAAAPFATIVYVAPTPSSARASSPSSLGDSSELPFSCTVTCTLRPPTNAASVASSDTNVGKTASACVRMALTRIVASGARASSA